MEPQISDRSEQRMTQAEFRDWLQQRPADDLCHYELIHGRIVTSPGAVFGHGRSGATVLAALHRHVSQHQLGAVLDARATYELPSGDTVEPDVSFLSRAKLAAAPPDPDRFVQLVPDLVVEILSPSTAARDRGEKKALYARNGVREYWLVDHRRKRVTVFHLRGEAYDAGVLVTAGRVPSEVLPDLDLQVAAIFPA